MDPDGAYVVTTARSWDATLTSPMSSSDHPLGVDVATAALPLVAVSMPSRTPGDDPFAVIQLTSRLTSETGPFFACPTLLVGALTSSMMPSYDPFVVYLATAAFLFGAMPVSPRMPSYDPFVIFVATAALPFGAVPVSPMTPSYGPFVVDEATAALPLGAVPVSACPSPFEGAPTSSAARDRFVAAAEPVRSSARRRM